MKPLWRDGDISHSKLEKVLAQAWEPDCDHMIVLVSPDRQNADIYRDDEKLPNYQDRDYGEWVSCGGNSRVLAARLRGAIHNW